MVERRCPGRPEAGELHPAPPGSQNHPHLSDTPTRPRTGLCLRVPSAEHTAGGPQVCAEGGCWGEQMRVTVEGPVRWAEESVADSPAVCVRRSQVRRPASRLEGPRGTVKDSAWRGPASGCLLKGQQAVAPGPAPSPHRQETVAAPVPVGPR